MSFSEQNPLDYRSGGDRVKTWGAKYKDEIPRIYKIINAIMTHQPYEDIPVQNDDGVFKIFTVSIEEEGGITRTERHLAIGVQEDDTFRWVDMGEIAPRFGAPLAGETLTEDDVAQSTYEAYKLYRTDANGILPVDISGNAAKVASKVIAVNNLADGQVLVWRAHDNKWHNENKAAVGEGKTLELKNGDTTICFFSGESDQEADIGKWNNVALVKTSDNVADVRYIPTLEETFSTQGKLQKATPEAEGRTIPVRSEEGYLYTTTPTAGDSSQRVATTANVVAKITAHNNDSEAHTAAFAAQLGAFKLDTLGYRKKSASYAVGDMAKHDSLKTGWYLECTTPGVTGATGLVLPDPIVEGASVSDGTAAWKICKIASGSDIGDIQGDITDIQGDISNDRQALAESTDYGIVSGFAPTISGLNVSVASGVVHLASGVRKEIAATTVTLDAADASNPRIDLVYINANGVVSKITGTAAATPSSPALPSGGISVATVSVAANGTTGTVTDSRDVLARWQNTGIVNVKDFGAVGDGVTDDTAAFRAALLAANGGTLIVPKGNYNITANLFADGVKDVVDNGTYSNMKPAFPNKEPLCKGLDYISVYPSPAYIGKDFTVGNCYRCQGFAYDSKRNKFIAGLISSDQSEQCLAIINPETLDIEASHNFTQLGHVNSITYVEETDRLYINGVSNANNTVDYSIVAEIDASTYQILRTIPLGSYNIVTMSFDPVLKVIVGTTGSSHDLYVFLYDLDFNIIHVTRIQNVIKDVALNGSNECVAINGRVMILGFMYGDSHASSPTHLIYDTDIYGNNVQKIPFPFSIEPEGACHFGDKIIFNTGYLNAKTEYNGLNTLYQITKDRAENSLIESKILNGPLVTSDTIDLDNVVMPGLAQRGCSSFAIGTTLNYPLTRCDRQSATNGILIVMKGGDIEGSSDLTRQLFFCNNNTDGAGDEIWTRRITSSGVNEWRRVDCYGALPNSMNTAFSISGLIADQENTYTPDKNGYIMLSFSPSSVIEGYITWNYMRQYFKFDASANSMFKYKMAIVRKGVPVKIKWVGGTLDNAVFYSMQ